MASSFNRFFCCSSNVIWQDEADSSSTAGPLVPTPQQQNGNLPAAQSAAGGPGRVPVQFVVPEYLTHWGQVLKVVGSLEELGSWKVEKVGAPGDRNASNRPTKCVRTSSAGVRRRR